MGSVCQKNIHFHYLPLPLAFRARGGFGTHWMHAERFDLSDPRPRVPSGGRLDSTTIKREDLEHVWLALHDADTPYCEPKRERPRMDLQKPAQADGSIVTDTVRRWICGTSPRENAPRDLHVDGWQGVVKALRR